MAQAAEFCSFQAKLHLEGIMSTKILPGLMRERETKYRLISKTALKTIGHIPREISLCLIFH